MQEDFIIIQGNEVFVSRVLFSLRSEWSLRSTGPKVPGSDFYNMP